MDKIKLMLNVEIEVTTRAGYDDSDIYMILTTHAMQKKIKEHIENELDGVGVEVMTA